MASSTVFGTWSSSKSVPSFEFHSWHGEGDRVFMYGGDGGEGELDSS